ncbi:CCN family member 4-like [Ruditapes philippinarum]|uniref:CCN family member 4-like n=1 Tax=Ruditapes philippinarum TaxID=129788 RepID=UPI00295C2D5F|nr:CCN family member 4-like [Ruditapes philippinarum]
MATSFSQPNPMLTTSAGGCLHNKELYREGQSWTIGCEKRCTCIDGKKNLHKCTDLCIRWQLPDVCYLSPPLPGTCCEQPVCPNYITIHYPPGYSHN